MSLRLEEFCREYERLLKHFRALRRRMRRQATACKNQDFQFHAGTFQELAEKYDTLVKSMED